MLHLERLAESTPCRVTASLRDLVKELGCERPCYLPVMADQGARADSCVANVRRAIELCGGKVAYGWALHECSGLWTSARFHAVRTTESGLLVDETPSGDTQWALFAPDRQYGPEFEFLQHPGNRRRRIYRPMPQPRRHAPLSGRDGLLPRIRDPLPEAIDDYLETLFEIDALFVPTLWGRRCSEPEKVAERYEQVARAQRRLLRLLETGETDGRPG